MMPERRLFLKQSLVGGVALATPDLSIFAKILGLSGPELKISLAQWSLHRAYEKGELNPGEFPVTAKKEFDIHAVEYVSQLYKAPASQSSYWEQLRRRAESEGVKGVLLMVDDEGDLGTPRTQERNSVVLNHRKWLEVASILGCPAIRVNAFGKGNRDKLKTSLVDGLGRLAEEGADIGVSVLLENHGLHTSDAGFMAEILREVNHPYLGSLPDFGNWCISKEWGSTEAGECEASYDPVKGLQELLPYAKGVSAKSYHFDSSGNETTLPYKALLEKVKASNFSGYIGIEYEGQHLPEPDGIRATKALLEKIWKELP